MTHSLTLGKKVLVAVTTIAMVVWTLGVAAFAVPSTASAAAPGSLVKSASLSAIYYYGTDGQRYTFPNLKTFQTWYTDFSSVLTISDSELAAIPLGGNVVYRPGSRFVKIQSDPKTYAVTPSGALRWIETEAVAMGLAGSAWNTMIDDVAEVFFVDYSVGSSLMSAAAYNGMFVMSGANKYVVSGGAKRMITAAGQSANNIQDRFFVTPGSDLLASLSAGADVSAAENGLNNPAQIAASSTTTPVAGGLSVSLASDTPAATTVPDGASQVSFMKFNLTANGGDATITSVAVKMAGLGATGNINSLYLYDGANRVTNARSVNSTTRTATFGGMNLKVTSGQTRVLTVVADMAALADGSENPGDSLQFQIEAVGSIESNATVSGSFPVTGNTMTKSATDVGGITIAKIGTISNPTLGAVVRIAEVQLTAGSSEGVKIHRLRLDVRSAEKHSKYELRQNGVKIADGVQSGDYVMFSLSTPFELAQGNNRNFEVWAKVGGESNDTIKVRMEETTDLYATGVKYGFGVAVTNSFNTAPGSCTSSASAGCHYSVVQGGKLTFAFNGPTTSDIARDVTGIVFWEGAITAKNYTEVRDIDFAIAATNLQGVASTDANYQNWRLVRKNTGATLMGPIEFTSGFSTTAATLDFTDDFTMQAGEVLDVRLMGDVKSGTSPYDVASGNTISAALDVSGLSARDSNNDDLAATDFVPATTGSDLTGNTMTVRTASLTINAASTPASQTVVKGTNNIDFVGFSMQAGTASKATVSAITFHGTGEADGTMTAVDGDLALQTYLGACSIYDGSTGALINGPESFNSSGDIVFSGFSWEVPASQTYKMVLRCNVANYTVLGANDFFAVEIKGATQSDNVTTVDKDGNAIVETVSDTVASANRIHAGDASIGVTVANAGTLTVALDGDSPKSTVVLANSTGVSVSKFKFTASNEGFVVDRLTIDNTSGSDTGVASVELHYKNQAGEDKIATGFLTGGVVTLNGLSIYVPKDDNRVVTVKVNTGEATTANTVSGDAVGLDISNDDTNNDEMRAVGLSSGTTIDDDDVTLTGSSGSGTDVILAANDMTMRKTKPTISLASGSPSGAAIAGLIDVLRFSITADSRGDVTWREIIFKVNATDNATSSWDNCVNMATSDFQLFDAADMSTALDENADWAMYQGSGGSYALCSTASHDLEYLQYNTDGAAADTDEVVAAGTTKTYILKVDVTGASAVQDDTFRADIVDETEANLVTGITTPRALEWDDSNLTNADALNVDGTNIKNLPVTGGALIF